MIGRREFVAGGLAGLGLALSPRPEGSFSANSLHLDAYYYVVLRTAKTVSVGAWDTGEVAYAVYDGTLYETDLAAADAAWNLWLRLAGLADSQGS